MENVIGITLSRKRINELIASVPGKPLEEVQKEYGLAEIIKLASNENPLGSSPKALEAMKNSIKCANFYPEGSSRKLREKIAEMYGIADNMVIFGNGADNILLLIAQGFINENDEVIIADPTFSVYETVTRIMGGNLIKVPLKELTHNLSAMAEKITEKTKLIFVCNPNNPTGTMLTKNEIDSFMESVPPHCIVIFDEAYGEFADKKSFPNTIEYIKAGKNVLMVRTLSKIFGLAGVRVGYAVGPDSLMEILRKVVEPFPVNRLAQAGAEAALDDLDFINRVLDVTVLGRKYLYEEFDKMDLKYAPSYTNFVFVDLGIDSQLVFKKLLTQGIIIRPGNIWGLPTYARITIGTIEQNEKLIKALHKVLKNK